MGLEIALVDAPATPRRDIAIIGLYCILLESPIASEVAGVLSEDAFVEVLKGGPTVDVVGDDPSPVIVTAVAGGLLGESLKLACRIASIVPTVPTAAFPLVLEVSLEAIVKSAFRTG